jgi:hypothetical protein
MSPARWGDPMTRTGPSMAAPRAGEHSDGQELGLVYPAGASAKRSSELWTSFRSMPSIHRTDAVAGQVSLGQ